MKAADHYLTLTPHPADLNPPLRWASGCDAVVTAYGRTLTVVEEIKLVLEGVFSTDQRPPFAAVLEVLDWCRRPSVPPSDPPSDRVWERLRPLVVAAKPTARNLGRLIAFLCEGLPPAVVAPAWIELSETLELRRMFGERSTAHPLPAPPLSRVELATRIDTRLGTVPNRQLVGLLLTGERDLPDAKPIAEALLSFPERLAAVLAEFRSRDRLVGAAFLAPLIDGALALPPRRPTPDRLPQGGYADVTTRGIPDRLLPSQFALDADEFVRRFAENELLYFRREEPHAAKTPTRVLLIDQGVRTWGPVRLGLAGAAIAVLTRDPARFAAVSVGMTSCESFFDPWKLTSDELATRLEVSDLTANPADLLDRAMLQVADGPRDIVLLTHPRNLREPAVQEARDDLPADDRLFVLTLDDAGAAELLEADECGTRSVRRFRVDLAGAEAVKVAAKPKPPARALPAWSARPWTGDLEPVPFPFRAGLVADVDQHLTFDADAKWVVVLGRTGALHAKRVNSDEPLEVLPRPLWDGKLLGQVRSLLPMRGGFAVVATGINLTQSTATRSVGVAASATQPATEPYSFIAARYDMVTRTVRCVLLNSPTERPEFLSLPDFDRIALRWNSVGGTYVSVGFFGEEYADDEPRRSIKIAKTARASPLPLQVRPYDLGVWFDKFNRALSILVPGRERFYLSPTAEGKPVFENATLTKAVLAADTLAVVAAEGKLSNLWVMNAKDGAVLHQQGNVTADHAITLSPDGRWLARQKPAGRTAEVRAVNGGAVERLPNGGYHNTVVFRLAADSLSVRVGRYTHRFWLDRVPFACESGGNSELTLNVVAADPELGPTAYDPHRFEKLVEAGPWVAWYDRWGQVVLMTPDGGIVMHVCVCRGQWAVVLPDGTRCGSAALLGGAPTPDAERLIGEALRAAAYGAGGQ